MLMSSGDAVGWEFFNPVRIHAGRGMLNALPEHLHGAGRVLLVVSPGFKARGGMSRVSTLLDGRQVHVLDDVAPNPELAGMNAQIERFAGARIDAIVGVGGGSVLDTAKILAAILDNPPASLNAHLLHGQALPATRAVRLVVIPTTAGTGSEVTPFATVWDGAAKKKYSVTGDVLFPDVAILDPELTLSMPDEVTLSTGLDAITQAFEATWSRRANPVSTAFAVRAIALGLRTLPAVLESPEDLKLRETMLETSLLAGLAISRTRTALCHSISYPITARFGLPHGLACALTLPEVFEFNREIDPGRFDALARDIGMASADDLHGRIVRLLDAVRFGDRVRGHVSDRAALEALAPEMSTPGRADNNLRPASVGEVAAIVARACLARGL